MARERQRDRVTPQLSSAAAIWSRSKVQVVRCASGLSSLYDAYLNLLSRSLLVSLRVGRTVRCVICHYFMMRVLYGSSRCAAPVNKKQLHINLSLSHFDFSHLLLPLCPLCNLFARPTWNHFDNNFIMSSSAGVCSAPPSSSVPLSPHSTCCKPEPWARQQIVTFYPPAPLLTHLQRIVEVFIRIYLVFMR